MSNKAVFTSDSGILLDGVRVKDKTIDLQGTADALILDEDGDTTISADTDDTINIEVGGTDYISITSNTFTFNNDGFIQSGTNKLKGLFAGGDCTEQENVLSGALSAVKYSTTLQVGAGGASYTLADGSQVGQLKKIKVQAFENSPPTDTGTVTPANPSGFASIDFTYVGDYVLLIWNTGGWRLSEIGNDANGTGGPTINL